MPAISKLRFDAIGAVAAAFTVAAFSLEGLLRPGYNPISMYVSELSLGPNGWQQMANFIITGALFCLFALAVSRRFTTGKSAKAGPISIAIIGVALIASGLFSTDPSTIFNQITLHGFIHGVFGAIVFSFMPISCFIFYRRFRIQSHWKIFAQWTLAAAIFLVIGIVFLKISQNPQSILFSWKGLVQRAIIDTFMVWLFSFSLKLTRNK